MTSKNQAIDLDKHMAMVVLKLRAVADRGTFNGRVDIRAKHYLDNCRRIDDVTGTLILFTRDTGHHSSGWMKNPDYERALHLSLSRAPSRLILPNAQRADLDAKTKTAWVNAFFGEHARLTWEESPQSPEGIRAGVMHYRLFCDEAWTPILPRGEVYSTELTELGWRSASQVREQDGTEIVSTMDPT